MTPSRRARPPAIPTPPRIANRLALMPSNTSASAAAANRRPRTKTSNQESNAIARLPKPINRAANPNQTAASQWPGRSAPRQMPETARNGRTTRSRCLAQLLHRTHAATGRGRVRANSQAPSVRDTAKCAGKCAPHRRSRGHRFPALRSRSGGMAPAPQTGSARTRCESFNKCSAAWPAPLLPKPIGLEPRPHGNEFAGDRCGGV